MDQKERDSLSNELLKYKNFLQQREEEIRQGKNNYSLIGSLLGIHDEVRLHSRFIYSMINPNGSHFQNDLFLKLFIECIDPEILKNFNLSNAQVFKERDNIDLLIEDGNTFIIIENKLHALDQKAQISRYIKEVQNNNNDANITIIVVYLSIAGKDPDDISLQDDEEPKNLEKAYKIKNHQLINDQYIFEYYPISYQYNISQWIQQSLVKINNVSNLYNAFSEYQNIVNRVNKLMNHNSVSTFTDFILKQDVIEINEYLQFSANVVQNLHKIWATQIINTIYSAHQLSELIISDEQNDLIITEDNCDIAINKLCNWLNRSGKPEDYKNMKLYFYNKNRNKKNVLVFGVIVLYIGAYNKSFSDVANTENKKKNALFGVGKDFRNIITHPNMAAQVCSKIKERIEQLINQE